MVVDFDWLAIGIIEMLFVIPYIIITYRSKNFSWEAFGLNLVVSIYVLILIDLLLLPLPIDIPPGITEKRNNFVPFLSSYLILKSPFGFKVGLANMLSKILIFIPLGLIMPLLLKVKSAFSVIKVGIFILSLIEMLQALMGYLIQFNYKSIDVDDVILGLFGTLLGLAVFKQLQKMNVLEIHH